MEPSLTSLFDGLEFANKYEKYGICYGIETNSKYADPFMMRSFILKHCQTPDFSGCLHLRIGLDSFWESLETIVCHEWLIRQAQQKDAKRYQRWISIFEKRIIKATNYLKQTIVDASRDSILVIVPEWENVESPMGDDLDSNNFVRDTCQELIYIARHSNVLPKYHETWEKIAKTILEGMLRYYTEVLEPNDSKT